MCTNNIILKVFGRSAVGTKRAKDEDSFVISDLTTPPIQAMMFPVALHLNDRGILMAVSDGMGGAPAGEIASSLVLSHLDDRMSNERADNSDDADVALRVSVEAANENVFNTAIVTGRRGMGATLTAVLFQGGYAHIAEIGDSRAYLVRDGRMVQLTRDQSYVQMLIDAGAVTQEESETCGYRKVIMQAMGVRPDINVALSRISFRRYDRFLVCSNGLTGTLSDQEIVNIILDSDSLDSACDTLIETAVDHGSVGDTTVILAEVDGEGASQITDSEKLALQTATACASKQVDPRASSPQFL